MVKSIYLNIAQDLHHKKSLKRSKNHKLKECEESERTFEYLKKKQRSMSKIFKTKQSCMN